MTIIRVGLDTSKHVFQIHGVDENEQPVLRRQVRRSGVAKILRQIAGDAAPSPSPISARHTACCCWRR